MPEPTTIEQPAIAAEAFLGDKASSASGILPAERERRAIAEKLRSENAKDLTPRQIAEGISPHPAPSEADINHINNENFGIKRMGGDRVDAGEKDFSDDPKAEQRKKAADKSAKFARELLDRGFDGIEDSAGFTKAEKQRILVDQLVEVSKSWPAGKAFMDTMTDSEQKTRIIEVFLKNPQFLKKLNAKFGEVYSGEEAILKDLVAEGEDEYRLAKGAFDRKEKEVGGVTKRIGEIESRIKDFAIGGKDYDRFVEFDNKKKREIETKQASLAREKERIRELEGGFYKGVRFAEDKRTEMLEQAKLREEALETDLEPLLGAFDEWQKMQKESEEITKELKELKEKEPGMQGELADLDIKKQQSERKRNVSRAARAAEEEKFMHEVEGIVREAGARHMTAEVEKYEAGQKKLSAKAVEQAADSEEKALQRSMNRDWRMTKEVGTFRKRSVEVVDKDQARADYEVMIRERSMDWYVTRTLNQELTSLAGRVGVGSTEYKEAYERIQDKLKDKEFMKKMSGQAAERLMKNYFESGNKVKREDVSILVETEWGMAAIDAGLARRKEVDDAVEKMRQANSFSGSKGEFIKALARNPNAYKKAGIGAAAILALIFGAPFLAVGAGALAGGYSALGSAAGAPVIG